MELKENTIEIYRLELLLENFETRGGDFIDEEKLRKELIVNKKINVDSNDFSNGID